MKQLSHRNKTICLTDEQKMLYLKEVTSVSDIRADDVTDKVFCGDVLDALEALPDGFAQLIIIDPPYNLSKDFGGKMFKSMTDEQYEGYLMTWFEKVCSKLSKSGSLYLCGDWKCTSALQRVMEKYLVVLNRITWQRDKGRGALSNWKNGMEDIWFGVKNAGDYFFNVEAVKQKRRVIAPYQVDGKPKDWQESEDGRFRMTYPSNFWDDISIPYWSMAENTPHPTQKPEKLIAKLILASSKEGDMVFDPFMGSGTTAVVAKKLGRHFCAVEINEDYCAVAQHRLRMAKDDKRIQGYADGVFWERNTQHLTNKEKKNEK